MTPSTEISSETESGTELEGKAQHEKWMRLALEQARLAMAAGEVPVGAVLVADEELVSSGYNKPISGNDPTAHAEIVALRNGSQLRQNYRLPHTTLYVTIEPCTMCVGAMIHARVARLVYGASEPRAGAVESAYQLLEPGIYNHELDVIGGVLTEPCAELIQRFFREKRSAK